jgi:hypothetical protein
MLQLEGDNQTELEASYTTGYTDLDGKQVPASALVDAVIAVEAELCEIIAADLQHPVRPALYVRSADLANAALVPSVSNGSIEFIGAISQINDADDNLPLTEGAVQEIWRYLRRASNRYTTEIRKFKIEGGRIYHTRTNAYIEGCGFSRTAALARFSSSDLSPLPIAFEGVWVARTLEFMAQEGWFIPEASYYGSFADKALLRLKSRQQLPILPSKTNTPTSVAD